MIRGTRARLPGCLLLACVCLAGLIAQSHAAPGEYRYRDVRLMRGPCCSDWGSDLVVDRDGSVLIAGRRGSLDLDYDGVIDINTFGQPDPLISKLTRVDRMDSGWTKEVGGRGDDTARGVASDRDGGLYAVGHFSDEMQTGRGVLRSAGGKDGFIARFDRDGNPLWARAIGGTGLDEMYRVASDGRGNAYVIGTATGDVDVDRDGDVDVVGTAKGSALVSAWDANGRFLWARISGGDARVLGLGITTGPGGEVYVAGAYQDGAPDFDGNGEADGPVATTAAPGPDGSIQYDLNGYYARLDAVGRVQWIRTVTGPSIQSAGGLAVADNGDLYVLGGHSAPSDFDGDGVADIDFVSLGERRNQYHIDANLYLLRVTAAGEVRWSRTYTASGTHLSLRGTRLLVSGTYSNDLDFDNDGVLERESDGDDRQEGFVAILDEDGELEQLLTIVGDAADVVNAAGLSPDGSMLYMTGYTQLGADFDGDGVVEASSVCHLAGEVYVAAFELVEIDASDPLH
ncbi:MAG: hypothetical protein RIC56_17010 [Pseudomonadales bacterium]